MHVGGAAPYGLVAIIGRWPLFLLGQLFPIGHYAPFLMDLLGVFLMVALVRASAAYFRSTAVYLGLFGFLRSLRKLCTKL